MLTLEEVKERLLNVNVDYPQCTSGKYIGPVLDTSTIGVCYLGNVAAKSQNLSKDYHIASASNSSIMIRESLIYWDKKLQLNLGNLTVNIFSDMGIYIPSIVITSHIVMNYIVCMNDLDKYSISKIQGILIEFFDRLEKILEIENCKNV